MVEVTPDSRRLKFAGDNAVGRFQPDRRRGVDLAERGVQRLPHDGARRVGDQRQVPQILGMDPAASGQRVIVAHHGDGADRGDRLDVDGVIVHRQNGDAEIELFAAEPFLDVEARARIDGGGEAGVFRRHGGDGVAQKRAGDVRRGQDAHMPALARLDPLRGMHGVVEAVKRVLHMAVEFARLGGWHQPALRASEQREADLVLQRGQKPADLRLRAVETLGGPVQRAALHEGAQGFQTLQIHQFTPFALRMRSCEDRN